MPYMVNALFFALKLIFFVLLFIHELLVHFFPRFSALLAIFVSLFVTKLFAVIYLISIIEYFTTNTINHLSEKNNYVNSKMTMLNHWRHKTHVARIGRA